MEVLKKVISLIADLSNVNDHLDQVITHIKSCDPEWMDSSCDRPAIFGLMGHKEYVDSKIHELRAEITAIKSKAQHPAD